MFATRGTPVMTKFGPGKIKRYKKRSRCFVVNLEWKLRSGEPVKAYLQPNNIVILEVRLQIQAQSARMSSHLVFRNTARVPAACLPAPVSYSRCFFHQS